MPDSMKDSRQFEFLDKHRIDLDYIVSKLKDAKGIDAGLFGDVLKNIESVIGNQEIEWISRNVPEHLVDYVIYRYKFKNYPRMKKLEPFPLHLLIEPASVCNLRCVMCFQSDPSFRTDKYWGMMGFDFFKSLIDQAVANNCKALTLASRGEPTLHKRFGEMLQYCKNKFFEVKINTNAVTLNEELSRQILDAGVDIVVFSVDSCSPEEYRKIRVGAEFETVLNNIKRFVAIKQSKDEYQKTSTRVSGVDLGTQSKDEFLDFWRGIVDTVAFVQAFPRWDTYHNEPVNSTRPCDILWERMYVWYDGTCNPCDFDYKSELAAGNAGETSLKDIWLGEKYREYRELHLQGERSSLFPCNLCNLF